ncbi:MAG: T9SS type A sorting domain-containing protein [Bacteroidia bacterium]|nr:T9SS type A sorting domain-containing protein [Bacteroidia bacterium]
MTMLSAPALLSIRRSIRCWLTCLVLLSAGSVLAQIQPPKVISLDTAANSFGYFLLENETGFYLSGVIWDSAGAKFIPFLSELNDSFETQSTILLDPSLRYSSLAYSSGAFYYGGSQVVDSLNVSMKVSRVALDGTVLSNGVATNASSLDAAYGVVPMADKGAIIAGFGKKFTPGVGPGLEWFVNMARFDSAGVAVWEREIQFASFCFARSIVAGDSGKVFVTGRALVPGGRMFVLAMHEDGDSLWSRFFGNTEAMGMKIVSGTDGSIYSAGITRDTATNRSMPLVVKLDQQGNTLWEYTYPYPDGDTTADQFEMRTVAPTLDGGMLFGGYYDLKMGTFFQKTAYLVKIDVNGQVQWRKSLAGFSTGLEGINDIKQLSNGRYVILGTVSYSGVYNQGTGFIALLDLDGTFTSINYVNPPGFDVYVTPNPSDELVSVIWEQPSESQTDIRLLDLQGRVLWQSSAAFPMGESHQDISLSEFPEGYYFVRVTIGTLSKTVRVVKRL